MKEEFESIKERFSDLSDQAKKSYEKTSPQAKNVFENVFDAFGVVFKAFGRVLIVFIGILLLLIGFSLTAGFLGGFFGFGGVVSIGPEGVVTLPIDQLFNIFLASSGNASLFKVGLFLLLMIPVMMLIYHGIRMILRFERIQSLGTYAFVLWVVGLIFTLVFAFKVAQNFKYEVRDTKKLSVEQPSSDYLFLNLKDINGSNEIYYDELIEIEDVEIAITENKYYINETRLEIIQSNNEKFELIRYASARGKTRKEAKQKAESILYYFEQEDNIFNFDLFYGIPKDIPWSDPRLDLELRIPVGTKIKLDKNMYQILQNRRSGFYKYWSDDTYIMTENGLEEIDEDFEETSNLSIEKSRIKKKEEAPNQLSKLNMILQNVVNIYSN